MNFDRTKDVQLVTSNPENVFDAYQLFVKHLRTLESGGKHDKTSDIRTALIRYTLPKFGFQFSSAKKMTQEEVNAGLDFMKNLPLTELTNLQAYQNEVFTSLGGVSSSRTYRMHLQRMITWCQSQLWWQVASNPDSCSKYCPPIRNGRTIRKDGARVTDKKLTSSSPNFCYTLNKSEVTPELQQELDEFYKFQTAVVGGRKRQDAPLRSCSAMAHVKNAQRLLGWLHRYRNIPLADLCLSKLVPFSGLNENGERDDEGIDEVLDFADEFLQWLRDEREGSPNSELKNIESLVAIAKFLYHKLSKTKPRDQVATKRVGYRDIPIIEEFRQLECEIMSRVNTTPPAADESKKFLDWTTYKACVQRLIAECAPRDQKAKKRSEGAIAQSHQMALICLILSVFPDRGRTIRELELGRTLVKRDGKWFIEQNATDFKTGDSFCKNRQKRIVELSELVYPLLEDWLYKWRSVFKPQHSFVFTQLNGKPINERALCSYFQKRMYRLTGKLFTPHMVRDSVVTHFKLSGAPDYVLAALADLMAHSQRTQQRIYDRRTPQQKVAPALEALEMIPTGNLPSPPPLNVKKIVG
ncbi:hypothetical protein NIES2101_38430 [Calothrix sp. HK-06]|nr:hypothetical protein NIES2101_38430 [Calothrix sp. HK-06]